MVSGLMLNWNLLIILLAVMHLHALPDFLISASHHLERPNSFVWLAF